MSEMIFAKLNDSCSRSALLALLHLDQAIELEPARPFAPPRLLAGPEPHNDAAVGPARSLVGLPDTRPRARDLLFVDEVASGRRALQALPQQARARFDLLS